jgi:hypothetical protein
VSDTVTARGNKTVRQKKQILIVDGNDKARKRSVETDAGTIRFVEGTAVLPNDARGRDIADEYYEAKCLDRGGVAVVKDREGMWRDPVHKTFWGSMPEMPWKRDNEDNRRTASETESELSEEDEGDSE